MVKLGILEELKWETLQKRSKDNRPILWLIIHVLYEGLKDKNIVPTDDLIPPKQALEKSSLNGISNTTC